MAIYSLFPKVIARGPELVLALLSITIIGRVYIGLSKDSLSIVDEKLNIDDVRAMLGQHVNCFSGHALVHDDAQSAQCTVLNTPQCILRL